MKAGYQVTNYNNITMIISNYIIMNQLHKQGLKSEWIITTGFL